MQAPNEKRNLYPGIFVISAATLLLELTLSRIFDVILWNNMAYMIVSSAIFGFGLGDDFRNIDFFSGEYRTRAESNSCSDNDIDEIAFHEITSRSRS